MYNMKNKTSLITLLLFLTFISSCKEDDSEDDMNPPVTSSVCVPTEINYDNNNYTSKFMYNSLNQITKEDIIDNNNIFMTVLYEYSPNTYNIVKKIRYSTTQNVIDSYYQFEYSSDNLLTKETYYDNRNGITTEKETYIFEYNTEKELIKRSYYERGALISYRTFQYTNGLMTKIQNHRLNGSLGDVIDIEYDNKIGVISGLSSLGAGSTIAVFDTHGYPFKRNITKYTVTNSNGELVDDESYTSTYEYNSDGYPTKRFENRLDGRNRIETYTYNCK